MGTGDVNPPGPSSLHRDTSEMGTVLSPELLALSQTLRDSCLLSHPWMASSLPGLTIQLSYPLFLGIFPNKSACYKSLSQRLFIRTQTTLIFLLSPAGSLNTVFTTRPGSSKWGRGCMDVPIHTYKYIYNMRNMHLLSLF